MRCVEDEEDHDLPNSTAHVINTSREIRFSWFALAGWGVLCRGDVKRSIVFDVVGYDTAVARGDLLFFCFVFSFFFSSCFLGFGRSKTTAARRLCDDGNRHECGGGGGDRKLRIVAIEREREREIDQAHTKRKKL